jgi:BolA family transcriptional regulator, general stress-responsive regulator
VLSRTIEEKLRAALAPSVLEIEDDSASHAGHGASGAHVKVTIVSDKFTGLSLIARHRLVNGALAEELKGPIHALQIIARAPGE